MCLLNNFYPEDDPLLSKRIARINYTDDIVELTVLYSLSQKLINRVNTGKFQKIDF